RFARGLTLGTGGGRRGSWECEAPRSWWRRRWLQRPGGDGFPDLGDLGVGSRSDLERQAGHLGMQGPAELVAPALAAAAWSRRVRAEERRVGGVPTGTGGARRGRREREAPRTRWPPRWRQVPGAEAAPDMG